MKNGLYSIVQTVKYSCAKKSSDLLAEGEDLLRKLALISRDREDEVLLLNMVLAKLINLLEELAKLAVVTGTDSQRCVNKNIGDVVVAGADSAKEAEKCVIAAYLVVVSINKACTIVYIVCELGLLFNANNVAV